MNNDKNIKSFVYKYKNDDKYKAKVQLILYAIFIIFVVIYVNFSNAGKNYDYNMVNSSLKKVGNEKNLLDSISDNYVYEVNLYITKKDAGELKYSYSGKRFGDNTVILKNGKDNFYKIGDEYYRLYDGEYKFIDGSEIFDLVSDKYVSLDGVLKLIKRANLDHVSNESNGINHYKYNLLVRDIIKSYNGDDFIVIDVIIDGDVLNIDINYDSLFNVISDDIVKCSINYKYDSIDKVSKFVIIED